MSETTKIPVICVVVTRGHDSGTDVEFLSRDDYGERVFDAAQEQVDAWARALPAGELGGARYGVAWDDPKTTIWEGGLFLFAPPNDRHPDTFELRAQMRHIIDGEAGRGEPWLYGQETIDCALAPDTLSFLAPTPLDRAGATRMLDHYELPTYAPMERLRSSNGALAQERRV